MLPPVFLREGGGRLSNLIRNVAGSFEGDSP